MGCLYCDFSGELDCPLVYSDGSPSQVIVKQPCPYCKDKTAREVKLEKALMEIQRRTDLLLQQSIGYLSVHVEHEKRIADVLLVNQEITTEALK